MVELGRSHLKACLFPGIVWTVVGGFFGQACSSARAEELLETVISQLDTDDFAIRAQAEASLFERGLTSVERLQAAARTGSPELAARIVRILRRMYLSDNLELSDRAGEALETLSEQAQLGPAQVALRTIEPERQRKAVEAVRALGAMVRLSPESEDSATPVIEEIRLDETWKGGVDGLRHIGRLTQPDRFMVTVIDGCGVSQEDIQKLRVDLPGLQPQFRGAATLGIGPDPFAVGGCVVGRVLEDNAAEKAGVIPGDKIVKIDDTEIDTFDGLVTHLRGRKVGDAVRIRVDREGEMLDLTAKLQTWGSIDDALPADAGGMRRMPPFIIPPQPQRRIILPPVPPPDSPPPPE